MRLLYLPLLAPGGASEQLDLIEAFRARFELRTLDYLKEPDANRALEAAIADFKPHIVHGQYQETDRIYPAALQRIRAAFPEILFTQWCGDIRALPMQQVVDLGRVCDLTLLSYRGQLADYERAMGKPARYWQNAVGPNFFQVPQATGGIVLCANRYGHFPLSDERDKLVEAFRGAFGAQFKLYGSGWPQGYAQPLPWQEQPSVYRDAKIVLGHNHVDAEGFFSDRQLIAMASGAPHLCRYSRGLEQTFQPWVDCVFYENVPDAVEKARWLLDRPEAARQIGCAGQEAVRKAHTWEVRVREFEELVKPLRGDLPW